MASESPVSSTQIKSAQNDRREIQTAAPTPSPQSSPTTADARRAFGEWRLRDGLGILEEILKSDPDDPDALYLTGEARVLSGQAEVMDIIDRLREAGRERDADVLALKVDLFLGDENLPRRIADMTAKYPDDPEVALVGWLYRLDEGEVDWAAEHLPDPDRLLMIWQPDRALIVACQRTDPARATAFAERGLARGAAYFGRILESIPRSDGRPRVAHEITEVELPYVKCGPYFGIRMEDAAGVSFRMSLDTGSGGGIFAIHDRAVGDSLAGELQRVREKAIQYNYMKEPADAFYKTVTLRSPRIENVPVIYFQGRLLNSEGVFSPFAFPSLAVTIDPVNGLAALRNRKALERYLAALPEDGLVRLPYRERNGWIYVRAGFGGRRALMMVETGSRDVNVNTLAARRYGLPKREGTIVWQGKEHPVTRPDFAFDIGGIVYEPSDGLIDGFALGNHGAGLGSAGDIGPVFLKGYRFTIDPFRKEIVLERPNSNVQP